jgi:hypothetical protein
MSKVTAREELSAIWNTEERVCNMSRFQWNAPYHLFLRAVDWHWKYILFNLRSAHKHSLANIFVYERQLWELKAKKQVV